MVPFLNKGQCVSLYIFFKVKKNTFGNSLVVQWLGLHALTAEGLGSIPAQGTKIPQATWSGQNKNKIKQNKTLLFRGAEMIVR